MAQTLINTEQFENFFEIFYSEWKIKNRKPKSYQDLEDEVSYDMIQYENGEKEIKDLIESNLRPRVLGNTNPVKLGRCFEFLNNCYGFKHVSTFFKVINILR